MRSAITISLPGELLADIDAAASAVGMTRSAWIAARCREAVIQGAVIQRAESPVIQAAVVQGVSAEPVIQAAVIQAVNAEPVTQADQRRQYIATLRDYADVFAEQGIALKP